MSNILQWFPVVIIMMLFYSFCITGFSYSLPSDVISYAQPFTETQSNLTSFEGVTNEVQEKLNQQRTLPVIELGALVFYSGNILVDLVINFIFAIPQMIGFVFAAVGLIFGGIDVRILLLVESFLSVVMIFTYVLSIIQMLVGMYSGRLI